MIKPLILSLLMFVSYNFLGQELTATQNFPSSVAAGSEFTMEININRGAITGFMKFFQELPTGFTAKEIDSKGGSFSFADRGAKIVWIAPPTETTYTISYKITVPVDASGIKTFTPKISFISNNERRTFEFEPKTLTIEASAFASNLSDKPDATLSKQLTGRSASISSPSAPAKRLPEATQKTPEATTQKKEVAAIPVSKAPITAMSAASGKTYRVQIGAFTSKPKMKQVRDLSVVPMENGMTKYFSGDFTSIEDAEKRKEEVSKKGFPGAFIVSFENGKIAK